jgi:hypothetical protein
MSAPFSFATIDLTMGPGPVLVHIGNCKVNGVAIYNASTSIKCVLMLFDLGRLPVLGVDVPTWQFPAPFASSADAATNQFTAEFPAGLRCQNGLAYAVVNAISGNTGSTGGTVAGTVDWELRP